jgi:hypothetical protein
VPGVAADSRKPKTGPSKRDLVHPFSETCQLAATGWELAEQCVIGRQSDSLALGGATQCTVRVELLPGLWCDKDPHSRQDPHFSVGQPPPVIFVFLTTAATGGAWQGKTGDPPRKGILLSPPISRPQIFCLDLNAGTCWMTCTL